VGGKILPLWEIPVPAWLPRSKWVFFTVLDYGDNPIFIRYPQILYGANMAFDKKTLLQHTDFRHDLGRVRNKLMGGEDSWIFKIFGEKSIPVYYLPDAYVSHFIPQSRITRSWLFRRQYWQGRTEILLLGEETFKAESLKIRRDTFRQALRDLKSALISSSQPLSIQHIGDFMQNLGRLVQLRTIGKKESYK